MARHEEEPPKITTASVKKEEVFPSLPLEVARLVPLPQVPEGMDIIPLPSPVQRNQVLLNEPTDPVLPNTSAKSIKTEHVKRRPIVTVQVKRNS